MGSTGGGRDQWKRPLMGKIADEYVMSVYLPTKTRTTKTLRKY
jgi:UDP-N-acetylmuramyl tripeptide synthase